MAVILRHPRGDGTRYLQQLSQVLAGQTIVRVEPEAACAEGEAGDLACVRLHLASGDRLLIVPQRVEPALKALTGLDVALRFVLLPAGASRGRRILIPGVDG